MVVTLSRRLQSNMVICVMQSPSFAYESLTHRLRRSSYMHSPFRLAENMASPGTAHMLAWVVWGICASLILSATVIACVEVRNLLRYVDIIFTGISFVPFGTVGAL